MGGKRANFATLGQAEIECMQKEMSEADHDVGAVRPDERLDEARLAEYLRGRLEGAERPLRIRQFHGGRANLTYLLDYGGRQYVLRRPPLGPVAPSAHDMRREYKVLSVLHRAYPLAPRAHLLCTDESVLGADFLVMERRVGQVVRRELPHTFHQQEDAPQRMSAALVDALAQLQAVDYAALGLGELGRPEGFIERQVAGWYRRWQRVLTLGEGSQLAAELPVTVMDELQEWLANNLPPAGPATLVHNDFKLDNVMLATADPGRIVAVFDWDMCTLGDPLSDLGALLTYWVEEDDPPARKLGRMMPMDGRFWRREELLARYAERSGRDLSHIRFYHVLGLYRLIIIAAQIYIRYLLGQTQDARFASYGPQIGGWAAAARALMAGG